MEISLHIRLQTCRQGQPDHERCLSKEHGSHKSRVQGCVNPGCIITQGVKIWEKSIIGIGYVVNRDIYPNSLAPGFPARVVKKLDVGSWGSVNASHIKKGESKIHQGKTNGSVSSDLTSDSPFGKDTVGEIKT